MASYRAEWVNFACVFPLSEKTNLDIVTNQKSIIFENLNCAGVEE